MNRDSVDWRGYWAAVPTPYNADGSLALDLLTELLNFYVDEGLHGVLVNGTTGEWFSQSADERKLVARTAAAAIDGRIPLVIGCTSYTADQVVDFARHAMDAGASGFTSTPPPYAKPFDDEIVAFYEDIAAGIPDAPMMIYNWPHGTSVEISVDLAEQLVGIDTVVAYKESTADADKFYEGSRRLRDRVRVFGPYMTTGGHEHLVQFGGDGTVGGGSLFGRADAEFWEAHWRGEEDAARAHAIATTELFPKLWLPGGWAGRHGHYASELKALMALLGQPGGTVRRPRLPVTDPAKIAQMRGILIEAGLLPAPVG
jgi:4-hydroxy-tetrahydrodipicolinate synthase